MNFGIYLNNRAAVFLPDYTLDELLALGVEAEELGYHSVWLGDRLLSSPRYDPIVTLAAIGARTIMGLGLGGGRPDTIAKDCAAVGIPKRHRGKVFEEGIEARHSAKTQASDNP